MSDFLLAWLQESQHLKTMLEALPEYDIEIEVAQDGQPTLVISLRSGQSTVKDG